MRILLVFAAAASAGLQAQSVSPQHFVSTEAPAATSTPFGEVGAIMTPYRYQQVHDDVPPMVISGFAFRHNSQASGVAQPAFALTLDAWISTAPVGVTGQLHSGTFLANHGPDRLQVVTNRTITVATNDPSRVPGPFTLDLPFDPGVQFQYAAGGRSLVWEVQITSRTNTGAVPFDAVSTMNLVNQNPQHGASRAFTGCRSTGSPNPITVTPTGGMNWQQSGQVSMQAVNLLPSSVAIWVFGLDTTQWNGSPLPVDVPGSATAPSGTCTLRTDLVDLRVSSTGTGTHSMGLVVPANPQLHGATIYMQAVGIDPGANALGFTLSNLAMQQVCAPYPATLPVGTVQLAGGLGPVGFVVNSTALVTRFY
jgi:hypothetical protein